MSSLSNFQDYNQLQFPTQQVQGLSISRQTDRQGLLQGLKEEHTHQFLGLVRNWKETGTLRKWLFAHSGTFSKIIRFAIKKKQQCEICDCLLKGWSVSHCELPSSMTHFYALTPLSSTKGIVPLHRPHTPPQCQALAIDLVVTGRILPTVLQMLVGSQGNADSNEPSQ